MSESMKDLVNGLYEMSDIIDRSQYGFVQLNKDLNLDSDLTLKDLVKVDLIEFALFLSASDDNITDDELNFINDYFDFGYSVEGLRQHIIDSNINSAEYVKEVPISMKIFVKADNGIYDEEGCNNTLCSQHLLNVYQMILFDLHTCEGMNSAVVSCDEDIYFDMLRNYLNDNLKCRNSNNEKISQESVTESKESIQESLADDEDCVQESEIEDKDKLQELLNELNALTGLYDVKKDLQSLINLLQISKIREERGMKKIPISLHMVFSGNPGTGKTTVARLLAKIYCELGVLSSGHLVEVDRSGLVGGYVGQTAIKVQEVIQKSLGGILFIDEAYSLTANKNENDFGYEAVDTLLKGMEDHRDDLVVIVAGYPDLMEEFLQSNPGLRSRFNKFINFIDYNPDELVDIFEGLCIKSGYRATDDCLDYIKEYFEKRYEQRDSNFANGREVRNFFETVMVNQANRLASDTDLTNEELEEFTIDDVMDISID